MTEQEIKLEIVKLNFIILKMDRILSKVINHNPELLKMFSKEKLEQMEKEAFELLSKRFTGIEMTKAPEAQAENNEDQT